MLVKDAKELARQWVIEEAGQIRGFRGAFYHGSTSWLADDALMPASSDVDVVIVLEGANPPNELGKLMYGGVMIDVSYLPGDQLRTPEQVLGVSHLAGSLRAPSIITDPSGQLAELQEAVSRDYAKRR